MAVAWRDDVVPDNFTNLKRLLLNPDRLSEGVKVMNFRAVIRKLNDIALKATPP